MQKGKTLEAVGKVTKHLLVKYPAELTWYNVACHVLDQKTLKLKQVRLGQGYIVYQIYAVERGQLHRKTAERFPLPLYILRCASLV